MTAQFRDLLLWLMGGMLAFAVALLWSSGSYIDGEYHPMGVDSFLHARRILDTYHDLSAFYQWDTMSFAPVGTYNHWPWSYDFGHALALKLFVPISGLSPATVLMHIPAVWTFVNVGLLLLICRQLGLTSFFKFIVLIIFALMPLNQAIHAVGKIDHDFMELTFVLLALWGHLFWSNNYESLRRAILLGVILGFAIGVNISMFILQIPFLISLGLLWLKGQQIPILSSLGFAFSLILSTLAIAVFSLPLQHGYFDFSYLSWFQVYIALCTGVFVLLGSYLNYTVRHLISFIVVGLILAIPVASQLVGGAGYLMTSESEFLSNITETQSVWALRHLAIVHYTALVLFVPFIIIGGVIALFKIRQTRMLIFTCTSLFGLSLLCLQYRFNHFGSYSLYLVPLCYLSVWLSNKGTRVRLASSMITVVLTIVLLAPSLPFLLLEREPGWSDAYARSRPLYLHLSSMCESNPGIVLTPLANANYVRYHTNCSVLGTAMYGADNEQTLLGNRALYLLNASPAETLSSDLGIKYVLAVRSWGTSADIPESARLFNETGLNGRLLGGQQDFPAGFRYIIGAEFENQDKLVLGLARLFEIEPQE